MSHTPADEAIRTNPLQLIKRALALFDAKTTRRFYLAIAGSMVIALGEVAALLLVLPLMQLITGDTSAGALRHTQHLGGPDDDRLAHLSCLSRHHWLHSQKLRSR